MKIHIVSVGSRAKNDAFQQLAGLYCDRIAAYAPVELQIFKTMEGMFGWVEKQRARTAPFLALLDSRGKQLSSEGLAAWFGVQRDCGQQSLILAIGPADGWTAEARGQAGMLLSLGPMTLPHELARVVLAEQVYRAFTILAGHPYHGGHQATEP